MIRPAYYAYEILDLEEAEILVYHWHPAGESHVTRPHLHLSSKLGPIPAASAGRTPHEIHLSEMHVPTGSVGLEDDVRVLISEFNIMPLRRDWDSILTSNAGEDA